MISNLKVDIIYYKTSSDFELEFNLSGCCRMRIFKEKVDSQKDLVNTLARDVSRSRVIIIVSDLIGEKNGVELVCSAIGYNYVPLDKVSNSIKSGDDIKAPQGCLPLVTKSGQYGGCIVECGKQSIIIVSSDRPLRHEVMRSYIHQYIFDINQVEAYNERLRHENEHNPIIDHSNILNSARHEFATSTTVDQPAEAVIDNTMDKDEPAKADSEDNASVDTSEMSDEEKSAEDSPSANNNVVQECDVDDESKPVDTEANCIDSQQNFDDNESSDNTDAVILSNSEGFAPIVPMEEDESEVDTNTLPKVDRRHKRRRKGGNIALLIISILLLICFGLLAYYFIYVPITGGELPNDLSKILSEVFKWTH